MKQYLDQILIWALLLLILLRFLGFGWNYLVANSNSNAGDQGATLQLGLDLREHGVLADGTRHPLYLALLLPFAQREWSYFTWAKLVSLFCGALAIISLFMVASRLGGPTGAVLAVLALSVNAEFLYHVTTALAEGLLVLLFIWGWYFVGLALTRKSDYRYWALAGLFAGLAHLTKGTGNFLLLSGGAAALILSWRSPRQIILPLLTFGLTFGLVASPLLLYNYRVFGSPMYNFATTHAMWLDRWQQSWVIDRSSLPTAFTYFVAHTPQEALARLAAGLPALWAPFWRTMTPNLSGLWGIIVSSGWGGLVLLVLSIEKAIVIKIRYQQLAGYLQKQRHWLLFSALLILLHYLLFAWYVPIVVGARFFLPILPVFYFFLGDWLGRFLSQLGQQVEQQTHGADYYRHISSFLTAGATVLLAGWLLWTTGPQLSRLQNPFEADVKNNLDSEQVLAWLAQGEPDGAKVVWGPGHELPTWKYSDRLAVNLLPEGLDSISDMSGNFAEANADYLILDESMVKRYRDEFEGYITDRTGRLELLRPIPGWSLAYVYKSYPAAGLVFNVKPQRYLNPTPLVELKGAIELLGYRLVETEVTPGQTAPVWLYWQSVAPLDKDYTIFVHLVGPGGLQSQVDRQPLYSLWPTGRWFPYSLVTDRFDLPIPEATPGGVYQLYVGMYDLKTGQRLPMAKADLPVVDDALNLGRVFVTGQYPG